MRRPAARAGPHASLDEPACACRRVGRLPAVNLDYPSRTKPIEALAAEVVPEGLKRCREARAAPVNFVTHSMGGIVVRYYLEKNRVPELGRVVMLSPPNQGSEAADALRDDAFTSGGTVRRASSSAPGRTASPRGWVPSPTPSGIITGTEHAFFDAQRAKLIPGPNDGKVSVERAKVAGMTDFLVLPGHAHLHHERRRSDLTGAALPAARALSPRRSRSVIHFSCASTE